MLELKNVSKWYGKFRALNDCSVRVNKGEVVVFCGPSGSGKSSLIKLVNGLEDFQSGDVLFKGQSLRAAGTNLNTIRTKIGMVFQHFELFPHLSVLENLTIAQIRVLGRTSSAAEKKARMLLDRVGMNEHIAKYPSQLSGGQQQRVAIARAVVSNPKIILADEPTGNLDSKMGAEVMELLHKLNKEDGRTIVMVTHNEEQARQTSRTVRFFDGRQVM